MTSLGGAQTSGGLVRLADGLCVSAKAAVEREHGRRSIDSGCDSSSPPTMGVHASHEVQRGRGRERESTTGEDRKDLGLHDILDRTSG